MVENKTIRSNRTAIALILVGVLLVSISIVWGSSYGLSALQYITGLLGLACFFLGIAFFIFPFSLEKRKRIAKIILVSGLVVCAVSFLLIRLLHTNAVVFILGFFFLAFTFLPLQTKNRIEKWRQYTHKPWHAFLLSFGDLISLSALILAILFKIMNWPEQRICFCLASLFYPLV